MNDAVHACFQGSQFNTTNTLTPKYRAITFYRLGCKNTDSYQERFNSLLQAIYTYFQRTENGQGFQILYLPLGQNLEIAQIGAISRAV